MSARNASLANKSGSELARAMSALSPYFIKSALLAGVASLLMLASSWYMLEVYDRVVNSRNHLTLLMLTIMVLVAYVVAEVLEWSHSQEMHEAGLELDAALGNRVFEASFEANLRRIPGGTAQPLSDLRTLRDFLPSQLLKSVFEAPMALVFLVIIFSINVVLGWAALAGAVVLTFVAWLNERATQPTMFAANRTSIAAQQYADGSLRNAQVIEAMGMLADIHKRWIGKQREFLGLQALASDRAGVYTALSKLLQTVMSSLLLGLGAWLLMHNDLPGGGGMMIIASIIGGRVLQPLVAMVTQWRTAINARDAYQRLDILLNAIPAKPRGMSLPAPSGKLTADNLMVAAPGTQSPILKSVSLMAEPGEVLAVIGPSASGKTTLARVLAGLWPSVAGKARLDGVDLHTWDKTELGPYVGYLPQGIELFDGTVAENIARFGELDPIKVEAAAKSVGLHEFILSLPQGYDTEVGTEGARLSGGQRQRVGLARALYGDPVFVILDEPNSSLDEAGDAALLAAIVQYKAQGTTFVVMTHRTSVLGLADRVLFLRDGMVQLFGPRDEVLAAIQKSAQEAAARNQAAARPQAAASAELTT